MTGIYLRYRARMWWGLLKPGSSKDWGHRLLVGFIIVFNLPVLGMLYWGFYGLGVTVVDNLGFDALTRLLHLPVTAFGVFFLFLVLNRVHPVLFEASDAELLASLPVTARALVQARLTSLVLLLVPALLLIVPIVVFYGLHAGAGAGYHVVAVLLVALFGFVVFGVGAAATCVLALAVPARPLRGLSKYGTAVVLIPAAMALFTVMPHMRAAAGSLDQALTLADRVAVGPVAWLVRGLAGAAAGTWSGAALDAATFLAAGVALWFVCLGLAPRMEIRDAVAAEPTTPVASAGGFGWWAPAWLSPASRALWRRELHAVWAEAARTILLPLGMLVFFLVISRFTTLPVAPMVALMAVNLVAGLSMSAVGQEGKGFWILRSLPLSMARVLAVKLVLRGAVSFVILGALAAAAVLLPTVGRDDASPLAAALSGLVTPAQAPWVVAMAVAGIAICAGWGLAIGARFPVFEPTRKGQYVGVGGALAGTFGSYAILGTLGLSLLPLRVATLRGLLWFLPFAVLAFWVGATLLFLAWAAWHLERLES